MNQRERILDYLRSGKTLTRINSFSELGVLEAPARIHELKKEGHDIRTRTITGSNRYGETVRVAEWSMEPKRSDASKLWDLGVAMTSYHAERMKNDRD
jgi:hypothetical protein